jgi:hypothetical protein
MNFFYDSFCFAEFWTITFFFKNKTSGKKHGSAEYENNKHYFIFPEHDLVANAQS